MIIEPSCDDLSTEKQQLPAVSVESLTQAKISGERLQDHWSSGCDDLSTEQQQLPAVSVESLTQIQLRELIPKLVTFSTGEACDVTEKPKWWTDDVPWRENGDDKLSCQDEVGIEVLRDLIRGCYKYLGQEDLLMCPDLPNKMKPLPSSPQLAESSLKAAEPSSNIEGKTADPAIGVESENQFINNTDHAHSDYIESACDNRSEKENSLDGIPETVGLSNGGRNEDFDFLDLIDEEERERSLRENEDSSGPDIDSEVTKSISEKTEDSLVEKPDSPKAHLNNESLTLDNKSDSKEIKKTDETSVSQTEMIANDVTGENEMDVSEKCDEIDACQEAKAKTLEINEAIGNEEIHLEMTETDTVSDHEPGVYKVMVNENIQIVDSHEISKCKPLDDGQMSDYSNIDIDTKIMEGIELDKVSSIETIEKLADCETEANAETVESGQKVDDAGTEHNHGDEMDSGEEQLNENVETDKIVAALNTETDNILKGETGVDKNEKVETAAVNTETDKILTGESEVAEDVIGQVIEAGAISKTTEESDDIKDEIETTNDGKGECLAKQEDDVVWICFVCAKEFPDQTELMTHQDNCDDSPEDQYVPMETEDMDIPDENIIDLQGGLGSQSHFFVTPGGLAKDTPYSEMTMPSKSPVVLERTRGSSNLTDSQSATSFPVLSGKLQAPVQVADITGAPVTSASTSAKPVPTLLTKVGSQFKSLPLGLPLSRKRKRKRWPEPYVPPPPDVYFNTLGLGPTPKMKEIEETPKKPEKDCDIIDLTMEESKPVTPRTPRSLMSQWSRDEASGRRRQLSFTQTPQPEKKAKKDEDSSSDSDSSESSREERAPKRNVPCKSTIYAIPLTSPLGQRLKKHWQNENSVHVVSDIEQFCRTRFNSSGSLSTKARDVMDKLRHRPPPQITFRFTKKYLNKYHHSYKFNSADRREFLKKLITGLERESRRLLKRMEPCKVVLSRISKKDIKYWTTRSEKVRNSSYMNQMNQMHLKQRVVLEQQKAYRARYPTTGMLNNPRFIQLNNVQFRPLSPGLQFRPQSSSLPRQTFPTQLRFLGSHGPGPTPQLLVPHGAGVGGMLLVPATTPSVSQAQAVRRELTGSQKRKQDLSNVRVDDEISITILSSDEEDDACDKSPNCQCKDCQSKRKSAIRQKPRIGPASFKRKEALKNQQQYVNIGGASHYKLPVSAQKERLSAVFSNESAIGRSAQGGFAVNPAKSGEFMNFRMVNGQIQNLKMVNGAPVANGPMAQPTPVPHSPLILNKSIIKRPFIHSQTGSASSAPGSPVKGPCSPIRTAPSSPIKGPCSPIRTAPSSPIKGPCSPIRMVSGSHVHKDDDLGFEVIMIDSDEED